MMSCNFITSLRSVCIYTHTSLQQHIVRARARFVVVLGVVPDTFYYFLCVRKHCVCVCLWMIFIAPFPCKPHTHIICAPFWTVYRALSATWNRTPHIYSPSLLVSRCFRGVRTRKGVWRLARAISMTCCLKHLREKIYKRKLYSLMHCVLWVG